MQNMNFYLFTRAKKSNQIAPFLKIAPTALIGALFLTPLATIKQARRAVRAGTRHAVAKMAISCMDCCKVFWAIFFPPLAVALQRGVCTCSVLINICLTILGWIPGTVLAV